MLTDFLLRPQCFCCLRNTLEVVREMGHKNKEPAWKKKKKRRGRRRRIRYDIGK